MDMDDKLIYFSEDDRQSFEDTSDAPLEQAGFLTEVDTPKSALILALDLGRYDAEKSLEEMQALLQACGIHTVAQVLQRRAKPEPATLLGAGRLAEARLLAKNLGADIAVFDGELSGSQLRNLEQLLQLPVIDRTMLILQIFKSRAVSGEGKTQTELALLEYRLPRLAGHGTSLSRQGGGGGGGGGARRGGGETKLEYDRRYIRGRIAVLKKRLAALKAQRDENRRARKKSGVPLIALVGYTNVGKSSLLNTLTQSDVPAADMLFATLDPTARKATLPCGQDIVMIDTVGFVSRLPHSLVEAFKSTLEQAVYADILLLVCDASDADSHHQLQVTETVLREIGVSGDVPRITLYNKCDLVSDFTLWDSTAMLVSAHTGKGLNELNAALSKLLSENMRELRLLLPYDKLNLADIARRHGKVLNEEFLEQGAYYHVRVQASATGPLIPYICTEDTEE